MSNTSQNFVCYVAGFVSGIAMVYMAAWFLARKVRRKQAELQKKLQEEQLNYEKQLEEARQVLAEILKKPAQAPAAASADSDPEATVKDRLRKAMALGSKQLKINTRSSPESQLEFNELELEKLGVLKTILADGFDPVITIRYNTGDQEMQLSAYVASIQKGLV